MKYEGITPAHPETGNVSVATAIKGHVSGFFAGTFLKEPVGVRANTENGIILDFTGNLASAVDGKLKDGTEVFCQGPVDENNHMKVQHVVFLPHCSVFYNKQQ